MINVDKGRGDISQLKSIPQSPANCFLKRSFYGGFSDTFLNVVCHKTSMQTALTTQQAYFYTPY